MLASFEKRASRRQRPRNQRRARADRSSSRFSISSVLVLSSSVRSSRAAKNSTRSRLIPVMRIERERIGQLPGADAEAARRGAWRRSSLQFVEGVGVVGIDLEAGIVGEILLQEAVAAIHRAVRRERQHQVSAAGELRRSRRTRHQERRAPSHDRSSAACPRRTDRRRPRAGRTTSRPSAT